MFKQINILIIRCIATTAFLLPVFQSVSGNDIANRYEIASVHYSNREFNNAIKEFKIIVELYKRDTFGLPTQIENIYYKIGLCYVRLNKYQDAIPFFMNTFGLNNILVSCKSHISLGIIHTQFMDYPLAIKHFNSASILADSLGKSQEQLAWYILLNLGGAYLAHGQFKDAAKTLNKSLEFVGAGNSNALGDTYLNLANAYQNLNDTTEAEFYFKKAINVYSALENKSLVNIARAKMNYGSFSFTIGNRMQGELLIQEALTIFRTYYGKNHSLIANCYYILGKYSASPYSVAALDYLQQALIAKIPEFTSINIDENPSIEDILPDLYTIIFLKAKADALIGHAKYTKGKKHLHIALETLELSSQIIENLHRGYQLESSRLELLNNQRGIYSNIVSISLLLYGDTNKEIYKEKAFIYSEKTKYATLKAGIIDTDLSKNAGIPDSLRKQERNLLVQINRLRSKINEASYKPKFDTIKIRELNQKLLRSYQEQDRLNSYLESNFNAYHSLKYAKHNIDLTDIRGNLSQKDALVEFFVADTLLVTFVISKNDFEVYSKKIDPRFYSAYQGLLKELTRQDVTSTSRKEYQAYLQNSHSLYQTLIAPIKGHLKEKRIIIIPDPSLSFLPIGTLISEIPQLKNFEYHNLPFLAKELTISYAYSATLITAPNKRKWNNNLAAFNPGKDNPGYLFYSSEEVEAISNCFSTTIYTDTSFIEQNFVQSLSNYDIVHLSMHTDSDSLNQNIKLLFKSNDDPVYDGIVNYIDIYNLNSSASLVSLSACQSGYGKIINGEGVLSLARSFRAIGCPATITSLWLLKDYSSAKIMPGFYRELAKGKRKDTSLKNAKLVYLNNNKGIKCHPGLWGGLICIGNAQPITYPKHIVYILIGVCIALIATTYFFKIHKPRG